MRFGGSQEFPGSVEGTVKFDEITCCALERGFDQDPFVTKQLGDMIGPDKVKLFKDILFNSLNPSKRAPMKFVTTEEMKTVYGQIAKKELERIGAEGQEDSNLSCGHSVDQHQKVLRSVAEKMEPIIN